MSDALGGLRPGGLGRKGEERPGEQDEGRRRGLAEGAAPARAPGSGFGGA